MEGYINTISLLEILEIPCTKNPVTNSHIVTFCSATQKHNRYISFLNLDSYVLTHMIAVLGTKKINHPGDTRFSIFLSFLPSVRDQENGEILLDHCSYFFLKVKRNALWRVR